MNLSVRQAEDLETQILRANPLMEAFGNAKTVLNNNSSRFGKLISIAFNPTTGGAITGSTINHYLLEKSRVTKQAKGEQNYHVFYYLLQQGSDSAEFSEMLKLQDVQDFLLARKPTDSGGTSEERAEQLRWSFKEVLEAMEVLNISEDMQCALWKTVVAILKLGDTTFLADTVDYKEGTKVDDVGLLGEAAELLGIDADRLDKSFCFRTMDTHWGNKVESVLIPHSSEQAAGARDALLKAMYSNMFDWIIHQINGALAQQLRTTDSEPASLYNIHVLDIFGFEVFERNSLEQLCINFCNEMLQCHFNEHVFELEQDEYRREGVEIESCVFVDNRPCVELLGSPISRNGIFAMIDEELKIPRSTDQTWLAKVLKAHAQHANFGRAKLQLSETHFVIIHFAGEVRYEAKDILFKNRNQLHQDITTAIDSSSLCVVHTPTQQSAVTDPEAAELPSRASNSKKQTTLTSQFKQQLEALMDTLRRSEPHFVRCIKSNDGKTASTFASPRVLQQLRYAGILEISKIRQLGFPVRKPHEIFTRRFYMLEPTASTVEDLLAGLYERQVVTPAMCTQGHTKVLMKQISWDELEAARETAVGKFIIVIQQRVRGYIMRSKYKRWRLILKQLKHGITTSDMAVLENGLREAKSWLPHQGRFMQIVVEAGARLAELQLRLKQVIAQLCAATAARSLEALEAAILEAKSVDIGEERPAISIRLTVAL
jgi:myosin heavy subunit